MAKIIQSDQKEELKLLLSKLETQAELHFLIKEDDEKVINSVEISFPGKQEPLRVFLENISEPLIKSNFERFRFLNNYEAICSKEFSVVEFGFSDVKRLRNAIFQLIKKPIKIPYKLKNTTEFEITLQQASNEFLILFDSFPYEPEDLVFYDENPIYTIKIQFSNADIHPNLQDRAIEILNIFLFHLHSITGEIITPNFYKPKTELNQIKSSKTLESLDFDTQLNKEHINLYWKALSISYLPTYQYLLLYHILEDCFSQQHAHEERKPKDIDQLKKFLDTNFSKDEIMVILEKKIFKEIWTINLGEIKILNKQSSTIKADVSNRIYDIRNAIAHSKKSKFKISLYDDISSKLTEDLFLLQTLVQKILKKNI